MKFKSFFPLILLTMIVLLSSCIQNNPQPQQTTPNDTTAPEVPAPSLLLYKIIRPQDAPQTVFDASVKLKEIITEKYGTEPEISDDFIDRNTTVESINDTYEILIGVTNRTQSGKILTELDGNYTVRTDGNKIILLGSNNLLTTLAVDYFISECIGSDGKLISASLMYNSAPASDYSLVKDGNTNIKIICQPGNEKITDACKEITDKIFSLTGAIVETVYNNTQTDDSAYEILIGNTVYEVSSTAINNIGLGSFAVSIIGNKLICNGYGTDAIVASCEYLSSVIDDSHSEGNSLSVIIDSTLSHTFNAKLNTVPKSDEGTYSLSYYGGNDCYTIVYKEAEESGFDEYITKLANMSYKVHAQNTIGINRFVTLTDGKNSVNVIYTPYNKNLRIITEPYTTLPEAVDTKPCPDKPTFITQIGLENMDDRDNTQGGMCYLIKLCDGSFIIIDGGYHREEYATNLYNVICKQADDKNNIIIAAWIFTHAHTDHTGAFRHFMKLYRQKVNVEKYIYNFPDKSVEVSGNLMNEYITDIEYLISLSKTSVVYKAHAGQIYNIRNLKIEILYSLELFTPESVIDNFNCTSIMFKIYTEDLSVMFLGDPTLESSAIMTSMYGSGVKSDILQVGHHGHAGASLNLNTMIDPTYLLWPQGGYYYAVKGYQKAKQNDYFLTSKNIRGTYVAGDNVYILRLDNKTVTVKDYASVADYSVSDGGVS